MAKFLIIMCAFFAVSMAERFDRGAAFKAVDVGDVEKVRQKVLEDAKISCILSINKAIKDLSLAKLGSHTPEIQEQLLRIYRPAQLKLSQFSANAVLSKTMDVTSQLKTSSGTIIQCNDEIANKVIKITNDALKEYERILCTGPACKKPLTTEFPLPSVTSQNAD